VWWIDYYVSGYRKRERIRLGKRLAETVLRKRKVEIAEGKFLAKRCPITTTFDELTDAYLTYARDYQQKRSWTRDRTERDYAEDVLQGETANQTDPCAGGAVPYLTSRDDLSQGTTSHPCDDQAGIGLPERNVQCGEKRFASAPMRRT
jgi:hypothetical protein